MLSGILRVFTWPLCAEDLDPRVTSARINSLKYAVILVLEGLNIVPFGSVPPDSSPCFNPVSGVTARIALLPARAASQFPVLYFGGVLKMGYLCYSFRGFTGTMGLNFAETRSYERL